MRTKHLLCLVTCALGMPGLLLGACSSDETPAAPADAGQLLDVTVDEGIPDVGQDTNRRDGESGDRLAVEEWDGGACLDRAEGRKPGADCRVPQQCQVFCCECDAPAGPDLDGSVSDAAPDVRDAGDASYIPRDGGPRDAGRDAGRRAYFAAMCSENKCATKDVTCRSRTANFPYCR